MIILDTNVISVPSKPQSDPAVMAWLNRQVPATLFVTAINIAELSEGVATLPEGRRKEALKQALAETLGGFITPVLPFDRDAALIYPSLIVHAKSLNYTLPAADSYIAAIAKAHGFTVATRDVAPFRAAGVAVVNPWDDA
jgi:predicted nucleic acid-binding protein